ncbi:MAG: aryl-sulfate sulfotransferase [Bacteroidetes bacterium]|nr:aryl-sulfate sulfotransferase [Bacteroidota bacterium]
MNTMRLRKILLVITTFFITMGTLVAQENTLGLIMSEPGNQEGYILFAPLFSKITYLIDKQGRLVHTWESKYFPKYSAFLLPDGSLLRTASSDNPNFRSAPAAGGIIEKIGWDGRVLWTFKISDSTQCQHHDIVPLPNGNILANVWEAKDSLIATAIYGRLSDRMGPVVWSEKIVEINPDSNKIVWEWKLWDHLVQDINAEFTGALYDNVANNPGRLNINYVKTANLKEPSWIHMNAIDYNAELDQIMISAHAIGEIWVIDHSTTTQEAASDFGGKHGNGGNFIYRWGNPAAYNRGTDADRKIFAQHNPNWIRPGLTDAGKILLFNNGVNRPDGAYSSIEIIETPIDSNGNYLLEPDKPYGPDKMYWHYTAPIPTDLYTTNQSGVQRLPNGNINVCVGTKGTFFELTPDKRVIWKYINPVTLNGVAEQGTDVATGTGLNNVFRTYLYPSDYTGLAGKVLSTGFPIEVSLIGVDTNKIICHPNPATDQIRFSLRGTANNPTIVSLSNSIGQIVFEQLIVSDGKEYSISLANLASGMYSLKVVDGGEIRVGKVMLLR